MVSFFYYRARDWTGRVITGEIEAENRSAAAFALRKQNYVIVDITAKNEGASKGGIFFTGKVGVKDLSVYCRQFATMTESGLPLLDCLSVLSRQTENKRLRAVSERIIEGLHSGSTLAQALQKYPAIFPVAFVKMVEAGEAGGILEKVFKWLAEQYEKEFEFREKIKAAVAYPAFVLSITLTVVAIFLVMVIPNFVSIFQDLKIPMPLSTRIVFSVSGFVRQNWHLPLIILPLLFMFAGRLKKVLIKQDVLDRIILKAPVFGSLAKKVVITHFLRTFCTLMRGGMPILNALEVVKRSSTNSIIVRILSEAQKALKEGQGLTKPLEKSGFFPPLVTGMIAVGEHTGNMERLLEKAALYYEREVEFMASSLSSILEPFLVLVTGIVVGFVVISIMLPMFNMVSSIR